MDERRFADERHARPRTGRARSGRRRRAAGARTRAPGRAARRRGCARRCSSRSSISSSVRSRSVTTAPTSRPRTVTGIRFATSTRSLTSTTWSGPSTEPLDHVAHVARRKDVGERAARPPTSSRSSRRFASSFTRITRPGRIGRDDPLADPVQHRLALLEQGGDLRRLEAEGLPLDPAREQERPEHAEREPERRRDQDHRQVVPELRAHLVLEQADGDESDHPPARVADRHLRSHRASERAGLHADVLPAEQRLARIGRDSLADLLAVGVRVADALLVRDDDERRAGAHPDPLGDRVDDPLGVRRRERGADLRHLRDRARDRERLPPDSRSSCSRACRIETATPVPSVSTMIASCSRRICVDRRSRPQPQRRSLDMARSVRRESRATLVAKMDRTLSTVETATNRRKRARQVARGS